MISLYELFSVCPCLQNYWAKALFSFSRKTRDKACRSLFTTKTSIKNIPATERCSSRQTWSGQTFGRCLPSGRAGTLCRWALSGSAGNIPPGVDQASPIWESPQLANHVRLKQLWLCPSLQTQNGRYCDHRPTNVWLNFKFGGPNTTLSFFEFVTFSYGSNLVETVLTWEKFINLLLAIVTCMSI